MMMATFQEDVQSVLEQFVENVANLPAEIAHISEEMAAKDKRMSELRNTIAQKDTSIQRFIKQNGSNVINAKETGYTNIILNAFKEAEQLQEEKCALAKKAKDLITKHIKRLDTKIKDLQSEGLIPNDPIIPVPPSAAANSSAAQQSKDSSRRNSVGRASPAPGTAAGHGRSQSGHASGVPTPGGAAGTGSTTPTIGQVVNHLNSALGHDQKRRRLANGTPSSVPAVSSSLKESTVSQGAGTPNSTGNAPTKATANAGARRQAQPKGRKGGPIKRKTITDDDDEEEEDTEGRNSHEIEEEEDGGEDQRLYCTCQQVSYGNMVACDNTECPFEWFHWNCVGLQKEPVGRWFCDHCKKLQQNNKKD